LHLALARRLGELHRDSGLMRNEVCEHAKIAPTTFEYALGGARTPSVPILRRLGHVYGVSATEPVPIVEGSAVE
jgi:hypothetical protein